MQRRAVEPHVEHGNQRRVDVLLEDAAQVDARRVGEKAADLLAGRGPVSVRGLEPAQRLPPALVVADELAHGVEHVRALEVHVARALAVDPERAHDRRVVLDALALPDDVRRARLAALLALDVERLGVGRERLVDPHVRDVLRRDRVAPPFVAGLVDENVVPRQARAGSREVAAEVAVLVPVAVRDGGLVLHAEKRRLDEFEAVLVPRERAEPVLEAGQHRLRLRELPPRARLVAFERVEVQRERAGFAVVHVREVRVAAGVDRHVVVVDRVRDEPVPRRRAVAVVRRGSEAAVRDVRRARRDGDGDALAVRLVRLRVFYGPPRAGPEALDGRRGPRAARAVAAPDEAAVPRRVGRDARRAVVRDRYGARLAGRLRRVERDEERVAVAADS